jgi:tetratricopeptide (TPR) repeat protein
MSKQVLTSGCDSCGPLCAILLLIFALLTPMVALAQEDANYQAERERAMQLFNKSDFISALPILEKLANAKPTDAGVFEALGFSLTASTASIKDASERAKVRARARAALLHAQELGDNSNLLQITLENLSAGDMNSVPFSALKEADAAMREGEESFTHGELDKALAAYERALKFDPKLYYAALFAGDVQFKKGYTATDPVEKDRLLKQAGEWFARAIAINENIETAHRYWGDALMAQGQMAEARAKFIEAIIAEPGNRRGYDGLSQWAERTRTTMAHPKIEQPASKVGTSTDNGQTTITLDQKAMDPNSPDYYWTFYDLTRAAWVKANFAKEFPNEKEYRHSLREEAAALSMVAEIAQRDLKSGKIKSLSPSLTALIKLYQAGMLEPYIFFTRVDRGIARDYGDYRQANRDKLRRYWAEFVIASNN